MTDPIAAPIAGTILRIFMVQGTVVGVVGTLAGVALGVLLSLNLERLVHGLERLLGTRNQVAIEMGRIRVRDHDIGVHVSAVGKHDPAGDALLDPDTLDRRT